MGRVPDGRVGSVLQGPHLREDLRSERKAAIPAASTVKVAVVLYASNLVSQGKSPGTKGLPITPTATGAAVRHHAVYGKRRRHFHHPNSAKLATATTWHGKSLERRLGKETLISFMWGTGRRKRLSRRAEHLHRKRQRRIHGGGPELREGKPRRRRLIFDLDNTVWNTGLNRYIDEVVVAHKEGDIMGC